jgi:hypothetical protein
VASRDPFTVKECTLGTGEACGAVFLNKEFENLIKRKVGGRSEVLLTERALSVSMEMFDNWIKCKFDPDDEDGEDEYDVPLPGIEDISEIDLKGGYLRLTKFLLLFLYLY